MAPRDFPPGAQRSSASLPAFSVVSRGPAATRLAGSQSFACLEGSPLSFSAFSFHPLIVKALDAAGYSAPTPVQAAAIPPALANRDLLATAETGTGKTAAFVLPALQRIATSLKPRVRGPRVLVLTPTRELASQVTKAARQYGRFLHLNTIEIVGGMPYRQQLQLMARPLDIVVATPGRLIDHLERRRLDLSELEVLVFDEADRMLDMGFIEAVEQIAAACPATRQTLFFSATLDRPIARIAARLLRDPVRIAAAALHGDMDQRSRNRTLDRLRSGSLRLLVATDVAARGIDIRDVTHVINFDLPRSTEDYVHRIGRTGRAGASGVAISFAGRAERDMVARIERFTGMPLAVHVVPGLEPTRSFAREPVVTRKRSFRGDGKRFGKPASGRHAPSGRPAISRRPLDGVRRPG